MFVVACTASTGWFAPRLQAGETWWVEVSHQRELPTAIAEARAAAAEEERRAAEEAAAAEKAAEADEEEGEPGDAPAGADAAEGDKPPVAERVREMLDRLPKLEADDAPEAEEAPDAEGGAEGGGESAPEADGVAADDPAEEEAGEEEPGGDEAGGGETGEGEIEAVDAVPETLTLSVAMAGEVLGLDDRHLRFRPSLQPDQELILPLEKVTSLSRRAPGSDANEPAPPGELEYRVVLKDGSEVPGQLMAVGDATMTVAMVGSAARIDLPLDGITRVERLEPLGEAVAGVALPEAPGRHLAVLSTGEIVAGQLLPSLDSEKWLRIASPILTAEIPLSLIDLMVFPDPQAEVGAAEELLAGDVEVEDDPGNNAVAPDTPAGGDEGEAADLLDAEPEELKHLVSLSPGGMLWAERVEIRGADLLVSALGKDAFAVPLDRVDTVSFNQQGVGATAPVLVWGGFADEDDEFRKTLEALEPHIPQRKLLKSMAKTPDAEFLRDLRRARVLLVPEMESFQMAQLEAAAGGKAGKAGGWADVFRSFLRRGGNIIFLSPTSGAQQFFNACGLGPLQSGGGGGSWEFTPEGKKLQAKVDGVVENVNATHFYRKTAGWQIWGQAKDGDGAVLMGKRVHRGWVMVFGADFYATSDDVTETLVKMIAFRGRR